MGDIAVNSGKVLGVPEPIRYGIAGATEIPNFFLDTLPKAAFGVKPTQQSYRQNITPQQDAARRIGKFAYGTAITAPLGGAKTIPKFLMNTARNAAVGGAMGGTFTTGGTLLNEGRLPTGQELGTGVARGAENSWLFPATSKLTDIGLTKLGTKLPWLNQFTDKSINAATTGGAKLKSILAKNIIRESAETPLETGYMASEDATKPDEDRSYGEIYKDRFMGDLIGNAIFGAGKGGFQFGKNSLFPGSSNSGGSETAKPDGKTPPPTPPEPPNNFQKAEIPKVETKSDNKKLSGLFDKNTVEQNERLLKLMTEQSNKTGDTETYKPVLNELETILSKTRQDIDQPGYMESLSNTTRVNQKVDNTVPYTKPVQNVAQATKPRVIITLVDNIAPTTVDQSKDSRTISETLRRYKKSGLPHIKTQKAWNDSVIKSTESLKNKHAELKTILDKIDADDGKEHLADVIQNGAKPKNATYAKAAELYKAWADDLAYIEDLGGEGKLRDQYHASYSKEQVFGGRIREMAGGTPDSLFSLPHLNKKTDADFIGDSALVDTFDYRTKGAVLNAHAKASIDLPTKTNALGELKSYSAQQVKDIEAGKKIKIFDTVGKAQKAYTGAKKKITAKILIVFNKPTHALNAVMTKIGKGGGSDLENLYKKIRDSDVIIARIIDGMKNLNFSQKLGLLKKSGIKIDEGLIDYLINKKGMSEDSILNILLNQKYKEGALIKFANKTGEYEFEDNNVKEVINDFINGEFLAGVAKDNLITKATRATINTVATAHLGLSSTVSLKQLFEMTKLPMYVGYKNTAVGIAKALNPFNDATARYGLKDFESNYVPKDSGLLKGVPDKVKKVLFLSMQKMELFKNRAFALGKAEALKNNDKNSAEKLTEIRDVLFTGGNVAHKYNKPLLFQGQAGQKSNLGDALGMYFQFSMKNFDLKADAVQHKEWKKFGNFVMADMASGAMTMVMFGYPLEWALRNLLPIDNPVLTEVFSKLYENFKQHGQSVESGKDKDKTKSRYYLNRSLTQNLFPAGTQKVRIDEASEIMKKGGDYNPTGYKRFDAPTEPGQIAKMFAFGKTSTKNYKEYREELNDSGWQPSKTPGEIEGLKLAGKGALDYVTGFGSGEAKASGKTPAITKADVDNAKDNIVFALDSGKTPEASKIKSGLFADKSASSKSLEERMDVYKTIKSTIDNEFYTDEQKEAVIKASGAKPEDVEYYSQASKDVDVKLQEILPKLDKMNNQDVFKYLMAGRKEIADKQLISSDMITYLYDKGYIGKSQKKALQSFKYDQVNGEYYYSRDYDGAGGSGGSSKKLSYAQALKLFKIDLPKYSELKSVKNFLSSNSSETTQTDNSGDNLLSNILSRKAVKPNIKFG